MARVSAWPPLGVSMAITEILRAGPKCLRLACMGKKMKETSGVLEISVITFG